MLAGINFDDDQMKLKRAEAVHEMEQNIKADEREDLKTTHDMLSKNREAQRSDEMAAHEREQGAKTADREDKKLKIVSMQKNKPGFNDRGTKSDNVK